MADFDNAKKELEALAAIADSEERAKAIDDRANTISALTGTSVTEIKNGILKNVDAIIASQADSPSLHVDSFMPENGQASFGAGFNQDGITGGSAEWWRVRRLRLR